MEGTPKQKMGSQTQHAHTVEKHTWARKQKTYANPQQHYLLQQQNSHHTQADIANAFNEQFTNTIKHTTSRTNRVVDRNISKLE